MFIVPKPLLYSIRKQETVIQEKPAQGSSSLAGEGEAQEGRGSRPLGGVGSWGQGRWRERGLGEGRIMARVGSIKRVRWQLAMGCRYGWL